MKTILIPTDFSIVAKNAARFGLDLAQHYKAEEVVLYNVYQGPMLTEPSMPAMQIVDYDALRDVSSNGLEQLRHDLLAEADREVQVTTLSEFGVLDAGIKETCQRLNASMIVIGISGGSYLEELLIGSSPVSVANNVMLPVLIVPPQAKFKPIQKVLLACDFKKVEATTPVQEIKNLLQLTGAELYIVHIDEHQRDEASLEAQKEIFNGLFASENPRFTIVHDEDFVHGIHSFSEANAVDLVITITKSHGLFDRLFRKHHTRHLAFHTDIPLMCIHEEG